MRQKKRRVSTQPTDDDDDERLPRGLPCKLEGILESPMTSGYRNKCEFSVGYSLEGKKTVGFMLGNFREGMTAVMEPIDCPNVSDISCKYALIFQEFLQSSDLPVWNRVDNVGFWRQFTVREGRKPYQGVVVENVKADIAEVMLIVQVCTLGIDNNVTNSEFQKMSEALARGASDCSPPLPLTSLVVQVEPFVLSTQHVGIAFLFIALSPDLQCPFFLYILQNRNLDHTGISNAAPADCPLLPLPIPEVGKSLDSENQEVPEARIHDYINHLRFSISPTAFFQVNTLAAEKLYSLAGDWANLGSDTLLFDVCCGTGTIGLTLAHRVGMVIGIEMNDSAVSDAQRNAEINGIKNCRFVCGKAEDVMGAVLKEYLDMPPLEEHSELDISEGMVPIHFFILCVNDVSNRENLLFCSPEVKSGTEDMQVTGAMVLHLDECSNHGGKSLNQNQHNNDTASISSEILDKPSDDPNQLRCTAEGKKEANAMPAWKFRNVVAIVDPPRGGLHPNVIKTIRTHPRLRHLVYISCNPESLVANAIELCTPTSDKPQKGKANRVWRNATSASLARHRTKSMPNSEPFRPVKAMAVDLFPHTPHCEMFDLLFGQDGNAASDNDGKK
ncbi:hypothetical protein Taro_014802, partial [Colocasia esculenta]|nr:hypothetical protein [Colocasia esculenta]